MVEWPFKRLLNAIVRSFWSISDYGRSTARIVLVFFALAIGFGVFYHFFREDGKPIVGHLLRDESGVTVPGELRFVRAVYFSIVTMTTLGFGDAYANPSSHLGQFLLSLQVTLGYVLLGALVTRFAVLFTAGGPAACFFKRRRERATQR